jgi:hypothetical protein
MASIRTELLEICKLHYLKLVSIPRWKKSKAANQLASHESCPTTAWSRCHRFSVALGRPWFQFLLAFSCTAILFEGAITFKALKSASCIRGAHFRISAPDSWCGKSAVDSTRKTADCSPRKMNPSDIDLLYDGCTLVPSKKKAAGTSLLISFERPVDFDGARLPPDLKEVRIQRSETIDGPWETVQHPAWTTLVQRVLDFRVRWHQVIQRLSVHFALFAGFLGACLSGVFGKFSLGRTCLVASHIVGYILLATTASAAVILSLSATLRDDANSLPPLERWVEGLTGLVAALLGPMLHLAMAGSLWGDLLDPYIALLSLDAVKDILVHEPLSLLSTILPFSPAPTFHSLPSSLVARAILPAAVGLVLVVLRLRLRRSLQRSLRPDLEAYEACWQQVLACPAEKAQLARLEEQVLSLAATLPAGPPRQRLRPTPGRQHRWRERQGTRAQPHHASDAQHVSEGRNTSDDSSAATVAASNAGADSDESGGGPGPPLANLDHLLDQAAGCNVILRAKARALAAAHRGGLLDAAQCPADPADYRPAAGLGRARWAEAKAAGRCADKCGWAYGGDASRLVDCCRQRVVFAGAEGLADCLEGLGRDGEVRLVAVRSNMGPGTDAWLSGGFRCLWEAGGCGRMDGVCLGRVVGCADSGSSAEARGVAGRSPHCGLCLYLRSSWFCGRRCSMVWWLLMRLRVRRPRSLRGCGGQAGCGEPYAGHQGGPGCGPGHAHL